MSKDIYFLVEGGETLRLAKQHVADFEAVRQRNQALLDRLGCKRFFPSLDGTVSGVIFDGPVHSEFTKPKANGYSRPKNKTEWDKRFREQVGYDARGWDLAKALGVPTDISYEGKGSKGSSAIGRAFGSSVGFLWLSEDGPFALYVSDIQARVAKFEADGYTVDDVCKNFTPEFDGARRILKEEWEAIVAQYKLAEAKAKLEEAS